MPRLPCLCPLSRIEQPATAKAGIPCPANECLLRIFCFRRAFPQTGNATFWEFCLGAAPPFRRGSLFRFHSPSQGSDCVAQGTSGIIPGTKTVTFFPFGKCGLDWKTRAFV